jgi:hypothetical protein
MKRGQLSTSEEAYIASIEASLPKQSDNSFYEDIRAALELQQRLEEDEMRKLVPEPPTQDAAGIRSQMLPLMKSFFRHKYLNRPCDVLIELYRNKEVYDFFKESQWYQHLIEWSNGVFTSRAVIRSSITGNKSIEREKVCKRRVALLLIAIWNIENGGGAELGPNDDGSIVLKMI